MVLPIIRVIVGYSSVKLQREPVLRIGIVRDPAPCIHLYIGIARCSWYITQKLVILDIVDGDSHTQDILPRLLVNLVFIAHISPSLSGNGEDNSWEGRSGIPGFL